MSKTIERFEELLKEHHSAQVAVQIATAEQLERIADELEKQNAGIDEDKLVEALNNHPVRIDGRSFGRLVDNY